ncbi:MAG: glycosyltransferase [Caldilineaceae bacterium]
MTQTALTQTALTVSVVICAYTESRWNDLLEAVQSLRQQSTKPTQTILVIDHNPTLFKRAQGYLKDLLVIENGEPRGLSGARNSGLRIATSDIVAFMDEDAVAAPDWLERLLGHYGDPNVLGVGGAIEALWQTGRPAWFPHEFDWVVGCSYWGMPLQVARVRNLIGCNMSFRRSIFKEIGGFRNEIGRVGTLPVGCEETELCIRAQQEWPFAEFVYDPDAHVQHHVPTQRASLRYFLERCYAEGVSKAQIARYVGNQAALSTEQSYVTRTLPAGVFTGLSDCFWGHFYGAGRAMAILIGLVTTIIGYLFSRMAGVFRRKVTTAEPVAIRFKPTQLCEIELSQPLPALRPLEFGTTYQQLQILIRLHGQPLGTLDLKVPTEGMNAEDLALHIWRTFAPAIQTHLRADGLSLGGRLSINGIDLAQVPQCRQHYQAVLAEAPLVTVIIATRERAASLKLTLDSLLAMDYPNFEILVVDNQPTTDATERLLRQRYGGHINVRYVHEAQPGLASAHNRGLREIHLLPQPTSEQMLDTLGEGTASRRNRIVAFTDDDVQVDRQWLTCIVQAFQTDEKIGCVTGMILPAELQTPAQAWIEQYGGFSKGFERQTFDLQAHRPPNPLYPYSAGLFGSGANMAFRASALQAIGGFDPALGAGSKALGGDDLAAFLAVILAGYQLVYEPAVLLYHRHRRDYAGLRRQAFGYGVGLTAYLTKVLLDRPTRLFDFLLRSPVALRHIFSADSSKNVKKQADYPSELTRLERIGMLYGPFAYLYSRWQVWRTQHILLRMVSEGEQNSVTGSEWRVAGGG